MSNPGGGSRHRELGLRIASAAVLAPVAVGVAYVGGWTFAAFWLAAAIGVFWEWTGLVASAPKHLVVGIGSAVLAVAAVLIESGRPGLAVIAVGTGMVLIAVFVSAEKRFWTAAGIAYAAVMLAAPLVLRRDASLGFLAVIFVFAIVWSTDILAYFVGRFVGGPKLWRAVSPNKTWSGAVGGTLCAILAGSALAFQAGLDHVLAITPVIFGLSVASQLGDLFESALKRRFGAKDAGHLIPGHGGLMDRLDGFVTAALVAALLGLLRGGFDAPARGLLVW
ncbi:MAG TPA: phosphatidate cytidylyltransferase [Xanthobacteraceae bacterium]|nr:phosphatidate cytidylyltransferase [Xanthobacteraceae bacterium]